MVRAKAIFLFFMCACRFTLVVVSWVVSDRDGSFATDGVGAKKEKRVGGKEERESNVIF